MATYRYNVIVDLTVGSAAGGAQAATGQLAAVTSQFNQVNAAAAGATRSMGIFANAFKGAFIGALTGFAVRATLGNILDLGSAIKDAGVASVQAAADFQVTRNAFTVFAGSARLATQELRDIASVARSTPGLRLVDAETGAKNLRALGFEASLAKDLVEGLGKQKILSGADEGAINRVIVNLTQLASGSPRASQDIKEMIQSVRTLRPEIIETFGSIEKFKTEIARDPQAALEKFAASLKGTQVPAAGLTDALGKLEDAGTQAGRVFGEPMLEPLTNATIRLTDFINDNAATWQRWGQTVGDVIRGVSEILDLGGRGQGDSMGQAFIRRLSLGVMTAGLSEAVFATANVGELQRKQAEALSLPFQDRFRGGDLRRDFTVNFGNRNLFKTEPEIEAATEAERVARQAAANRERDRIAKLGLIGQERDATLSAVKSEYTQREALLNRHLRVTGQQELNYLRANRTLKQQGLKEQLEVVKAYFDDEIALTVEGTNERVALQIERQKQVNDIETQIVVANAQAERAIAEQEKRIQDERRQNQIEFLNKRIDGIRAYQEREEQLLETQIELYGTGFDELINIERNAYDTISNLTIEASRKQLEDQSLTAEQRLNIQSQLNIDLFRLETTHQQKINQLQERALQERAKRARETASFIGELAGVVGGSFRGILGQLTPDVGFGLTVPGQALGGFIAEEQGRVNITKTRLNLITKIHDIETFQLTEEIRLNEKLLGIERERVIIAIENAVAAERRKLTPLRTELEGPVDEIRRNQLNEELNRISTRIDLYENRIKELKGGATPDSAEGIRLDRAISILNARVNTLKTEQEIEKLTELQKTDLEAIAHTTQLIVSGQRDSVIQQINAINAAQGYRAAVTEFRQQEVLMADEETVKLLRQTELLREITELRNEELNAVFAIDRAQLRINQQLVFSQARSDAKVLDFLASQRGITEIISDTKINLLSAAYNGLDSVLTRVTRRFGLMADAVRDLLSGLLRLGVNWVFRNFLGGGGGGAGGGGGFGIPGLGGGGGLTVPGFAGGLFNIGGGGAGAGLSPTSTGGGAGTLAGPFGLAIPGLPGGGLLGPGAAQGTTAGAGGGLFSSFFGGLAGIAPLAAVLGGGTLGASLGRGSGIGTAFGAIGGGLAGLAGIGALLSLAPGLGISGGIAGALGVGLTAGLLAALPVIAVAAPLLIFGAWILGRNARRRQEERIRNTAIGDAFRAIDKLIEGVNNDRIDGTQALEQADQIRKTYVDEMSKLKDSKTRRHALQDVSRIDAKIGELKTAIAAQTSRRERLELMVPTFATGGPAIGYQMGPGHGQSDNLYRQFPAAGVSGFVSPTEYVLDAQTTAVIGRHDLDVIRATKGQSYAQMRKQMVAPKMANGGAFVAPITLPGSAGGGGFGGGSPVTLEVSLMVGLSTNDFVQVVSAAMKSNDGSTNQLAAIVKTLKNNGHTELAAELARQTQPFLK